MFFIFGISNNKRKIEFTQTTICNLCGAYGRLELFVRYCETVVFQLNQNLNIVLNREKIIK